MKRTVLLLVVLTFALTFAVSQALARPAPPDDPGAMRIQLEQTDDAQGTEAGYAVITEDATGHYEVAIHIYGMDADQWVRWGVGTGTALGEFQCNRRGIGNDDARTDELGDEVRVKAIDGPGASGDIVLTGAIPQ